MMNRHANDNEDRISAIDLVRFLAGLNQAERARILAAAEVIRARRRVLLRPRGGSGSSA